MPVLNQASIATLPRTSARQTVNVTVRDRIRSGATGQGSIERGHRVQLDSIRAIAVILVMVQHYVPATERYVMLGSIGVRVFFTLSGFLITGILLQARRQIEVATGTGVGHVLRSFYARRALRILPLFYMVLILTALLGSRPMRESFGWHAAYLSNVYFFQRGTGNDSVTHLWSLAVEEQFYLLWPILILLTNRRLLFPLVSAAIITGPIFRAAMLATGHNAWQASVLTPACLDTLGMGALLALLSGTDLGRRYVKGALCVGPILLLGICTGMYVRSSVWWTVAFDFGVGLTSVWVIARAYAGFGGLPGRLLSWKPLVHVGVISYGIYVMHNFVGSPVGRVLHAVGWHWAEPQFRVICMFVVTFACAALSWRLLEEPINRLKRLFPYAPLPARSAEASGDNLAGWNSTHPEFESRSMTL